jgi:hypothetical protein
VDDADRGRRTTVLFLLMALGMAAGLGAGGVALSGTLFLCVCLALLPQESALKARAMTVLVVATGPEFPAGHVAGAFADSGVTVEPIEISRDEVAQIRYRAAVQPGTSLEDVNARLMAGHVRSVVWQASKKDL